MARSGRRKLPELRALYGERLRDLYPEPKDVPGFRRVVAVLDGDVTQNEALTLTRWLRDRKGTQPAPSAGVAASGAKSPKVQITGDEDQLKVSAKGQGLVKSVDDLVVESETDLQRWRVTRHKVNTWTTTTKSADGVPQITRNWQVWAEFERRKDIVEDVAITVQRVPRAPPDDRLKVRSTLLIPDSQHGYQWAEGRRELIPLHDERACDIATQVAARMQPDTIVLLGDMLDLAEWSTKYPRPASLRDTTQVTLQRVHDWLADIRTRCPSSRIVYLEGNHEFRIQRALVETVTHAADLRAVGDDLPALSVPRLLGLDGLDIEYVGPFGSDTYLHEQVRLNHGDKVRAKGGATAQAVLAEATHTTWFGHVHRVELAHRTLHGPDGPRTIAAGTPGCLCRVDGKVPGVTQRPDWQQGLGFMWWDGTAAHCEVRTIQDGRMLWDGAMLYGDDVASVAA